MEGFPASMFLGCVDVLSPADKLGGDSTRNHSHVEPPHHFDLVLLKMHISNNRVHLFVFERRHDDSQEIMCTSQHASRFENAPGSVNTKEQIADILTQGSFIVSQ